MLPKEKILANRLGIAMHDWTEEGRRNMVEWVTDALKEQREHEREACIRIAIDYAIASAGVVGQEHAAQRIAALIRSRGEGV